MSKCELCGGYNGLAVEHHPFYEVPDVWETLCRDCAEQENLHTAEDMDDGELVAAIMDDSMGYASPQHAQQHVEAWRDGEDFAFCERAISCYPADPDDYTDEEFQTNTGIHPGDLNRLIESARKRWCAASGEKRERLEAFAEKWAQLEEEEDGFTGVGSMYPTLGV